GGIYSDKIQHITPQGEREREGGREREDNKGEGKEGKISYRLKLIPSRMINIDPTKRAAEE
ncbi:hypothetical protein INR49_028510, partial [Caranx melampygus]